MMLKQSGVILLALFALAACDQEAGTMQDFPAFGSPATAVPPPQGFVPPESGTDNEVMTENLTNAVDEALGLTEDNIEPIPGAPVTPVTPAGAPSTGTELASDSGVLNLALSSQEEQRIAREADAAAIAAAAAQRVVIEPGQMPEVIAGVNIIAYARSTTNRVGQRVVRRPRIQRRDNRRECAKFASADDAQRNFLANGGPAEDPLNLDPDGDGFACRWSPEAYRALQLD